ncbi:MAG: UvrD-helicase domain-containing protein [Ferrovum sp.]|nr:UvrD-helicase domain-containing protein [Ferrovum sp.]NDU86914.1 UvrD-helicase domain-containing protein [Ferrovum sp.]
MTSTILDGLNDAQREAVTWAEGSALVLAGAGSGKTRVLTTRMAWLMQTSQARPTEMLAVTFTNKAAREMVTRLSSLWPVPSRDLWVGTFHGLCHRFLRIHAQEAQLPAQFQILDMQDQLALIKRILKSLQWDDEQTPPRQVQQFINSHKEQGLRAHAVTPATAAQRRFQEVYEVYEKQCQREGGVDFAELLLRCVELWHHHAALREHYQQRFKFLLVDEFQDTNRLQYRWLRLLSGAQTAVFAVGDDDQSIYSFRGAEVENMRHFQKDFGLTRILRLEQNYRSLGTILDAANALIDHNPSRFGKKLWTDGGSGEPIGLYAGDNEMAEARFIAEEVQRCHHQGTRLSDMALLYRSNAQSRALEQVLFNHGLPYRVYGGLRFFERQEVRHVLAYLRLALNPEDDASFLRVVNFPPRGIGPRSLEGLHAKAAGTSLYQAALNHPFSGKTGQGLQSFLGCIEGLKKAVQEGLLLPAVVRKALEDSGLLMHYRQEKEGAERVENLEEMEAAALAFSLEREEGDLLSFLAHASLEAGDQEASPGTDALQLMTVHAAKGLEFDVVWVAGMEDGLFPHENALGEVKGLEEERRLAYVAITRARRRLYLTYAHSRMLQGQVRYGLRSRFLEEIPEGLCRWLSSPGLSPKKTYFSGYETSLAPSASAVKSGNVSSRFHIGQSVRHEKFGSGVVLAAEGDGSEGRLQVNFRDAGVKWLALAFAKLTPLAG